MRSTLYPANPEKAIPKQIAAAIIFNTNVNFFTKLLYQDNLTKYAAILFSPKGTKRFRDADSNVLHPKFRYVFLIIFMFVILLNIVVDVLGGMNHLTFFVLEFSQINTVDYMDAVAGTMSVCISASFYYYAVWHRSGSRWPRF